MHTDKQPIRVIKLEETHQEEMNAPSDALAMFRIWTLLTGGAATRDLTVAERKLI